MVGAQENLLFLGESRTLRGRERINLLVHACRSHSLSFPFFFSSKIPLSYLFFSLFLFLNTCFLFPSFEIPNPLMLVSLPYTQQMAPFIVPAMIWFYYFGPQQLLSILGILIDHHWFVCVPLLIARQRKIILFVCLSWHLFLLWSKCLLSPYPS